MPAKLPVIDVSAPLCCPPIGACCREVEDRRTDAEQIAARLRALADARRVELMMVLGQSTPHEISTSRAAEELGVSDATASHHLSALAEAGLVTRRKEGRSVAYVLEAGALDALTGALDAACCEDACTCSTC